MRVGRLGVVKFRAGFYFYVGSAKRNLSTRLARHARRRKKLRWHIDYLSARAKMVGAIVITDRRRSECRLAGELEEMFDRPGPASALRTVTAAGIFSTETI